MPKRPGIFSPPRPLSLVLALLALMVVASAFFAIDPVRDAATLAPVTEVALRKPASYVLLAPLSNVLDTVTLLSARQHIAAIVTLIAFYAMWWWLYARTTLERIVPERRVLREAARLGVGFAVLLTVYASAVLLPRPVAKLEAVVNVVIIDFHAHTKYSHDGRAGWTPEDVRAWHKAAGFDVAYISDHRTFEGARLGWMSNPGVAADNTVLIPAIEVGWRGEHVNVLDADRTFRGLLTPDLRDVDSASLVLASAIPGSEPVLVETLPGNPAHVIAAAGSSTAGIRAIELIDGSPRGLGQTRRERAAIVRMADSLNLSLVAGSDNHGWGRAAAGWTLMFIPNWRGAPPGDLATAISAILRRGGNKSTRVVERTIPDTDRWIALPATVPVVAWGMFRTLTNDERAVWIVLLGLIHLYVRMRDRRLLQGASAA